VREIDGNAVNLVPAKIGQECAIPLADFLPGGVIGGKFGKFFFDRTHLPLSLPLLLPNANITMLASLPMPIVDRKSDCTRRLPSQRIMGWRKGASANHKP
jgi:hypothetical protein